MRVCHLISADLWAGAEAQALTLMRSLNTAPGVQLSAMVLNEGRLAEELRKADIDVSVADERKYGFFTLKSLLVRALHDRQIDILHTHRYKENVLGGLIMKRCGIKALVQTVHGIREELRGIKQLKMKFYMSLNDDLTRKRFSRVVAVSHEIAAHLEAKFGRQMVVTIHNAVDTSLMKPSRSAEEIRRELGIGEDRFVIGSAGRLVPVKAYDLFLKAAQLILKKHSRTVFVIVGDGPLRRRLEELSERLGIRGSLILTGFRDDVLDVVNSFDVYLVSSIHEGVPMSVLEAMAMEKSVVSTAVGGITEIIEDNVSGLLATPGDSSAIADRCLALMENSELRSSIGQCARRRIEKDFSSETQRDRVLRLYREVMSQR